MRVTNFLAGEYYSRGKVFMNNLRLQDHQGDVPFADLVQMSNIGLLNTGGFKSHPNT